MNEGSIIHLDTWTSYQQIESIPEKIFHINFSKRSQKIVDPDTLFHTPFICIKIFSSGPDLHTEFEAEPYPIYIYSAEYKVYKLGPKSQTTI